MPSPSRRDRLKMAPLLRRAIQVVWQAASRDLTKAIVYEVIVAMSLAGVLIFGRDVVTKLTLSTGPASTGEMLPVVIGLAAAMLVSGLAQVLVAETRGLIAEQTAVRTQDEIVEIATSVDYQQFESQDFHDLLQRATARASQSAYQIVYDVLNLINVGATSLAVVAVLLTSVPTVLPVILLVAIPFGLAARASARLAFDANYELTTADRLRSYLFGALVGKDTAKELRVFSLAEPLHRRWSALYGERIVRLRRLARHRTIYNGAAALAAAALVGGVLLVLVDAAAADRITIADAAIAIVALQQLSTRIRGATNSTGSLRTSALYLEDFERFKSLRGVNPAPQSVQPLPSGELRLENVSFTYPGTNAQVLEDVSLSVAPGEVVALVGVSGSGKTTLSHLVAGLYHPTSGRVTFGGQDISTIEPALYKRSLAVVFQDYVHYQMTARENIAMSDQRRLDDVAGVAEAARRAGIAEALESLTAGYETLMSRAYEGGADLSVGQWQRMAIARAFFREAPLLVLDEPAAALDAKAEQALVNRLNDLVSDRSVLMISHRFSTVRLADRIVVLSDGGVAEEGTHEELIRRDGLYAELFSMQAKGYLPMENR